MLRPKCARVVGLSSIYCLVAIVSASLSPRLEGQVSKITVDGSKNPELIPDEIAYQSLFLMVSADSNGSDISRKRAAAFLKALRLTAQDQAEVAGKASSFRQSHQTISGDPQPVGVAARFQRQVELVNIVRSDLSGRLSTDGNAKLRDFVQQQKRHIKLFPIPDMDHHASNTLLQGLLNWFSLPKVYAQMNPSGSIYTNTQGDYQANPPDGESGAGMYAYGVTSAGGCSCHTVSAWTTITSPNGRYEIGNADPRPGVEFAESTAYMAFRPDDMIDGSQVQVETYHQAYCPVIGSTFIQESTYAPAPLMHITAYYRYVSTNQGQGLYNRCNPIGTICDSCSIHLGPATWQYGLFDGGEIHIGFTNICVMAAVEQVDRCYSPDPVPGSAPGPGARNRLKNNGRFRDPHDGETTAKLRKCQGCASPRLTSVSKEYH